MPERKRSGRGSAARFRELALTDALTGLANRRAFDDALKREWQRCARSSAPLSLLMIDIDYFKVYNDTYGHLGGDDCLRRVAEAIGAGVKRPGDVAARYGGEEFAIVLPETPLMDACAIGEALASAVRTLAVPHEGSSLGHVSISVGCAALVPQRDGNLQALLELADRQLYRAKESGRNRVATQDAISEAPRAERMVVAKHNLPPARTSFVARTRELTELEALTGRLLTLVGPGGAGKTRLAKELALRIAGRHADGAWFVDLTSVAPGVDSVAQAIAGAMFPMMASGVTAALLEQLVRSKAALIVLDNAEHLTESVATLADRLLDAAPGMRFLVTSREPLEIDGEFVHRLALLDASDAVHLFVERARAAGAGPDALSVDADAIEQIVRKLEGLPLAIEMAASSAATLAPPELLLRLTERLAALQTRSRSASARHRSLEATLDWSYDLLDEPARAVFRRLGVFAGGCLAEAARAVCASDAVSKESVGSILDALVAKSLVVSDESARYRLLESTREYALEKLESVGEREDALASHAAYFNEHAAQSITHANESHGSVEARERPELPNYRVALRTYLEVAPDTERAALLLWNLRVLTAEFEREFSEFESAIRAARARAPSGLAGARLALALSELALGVDNRERTDAARDAVELFGRAGDALGWAQSIQQLHANYLAASGVAGHIQLDEMQRALEVARSAGDRRLAALLLFKIGIDLAYAERLPEAIARFEEARGTADPEDWNSLALIVGNIGVARMHLHDYAAAAEALTAALELALERRPWRAGLLYVNLAYLNYFRERYEPARAAISSAIECGRTYSQRMVCALAFDVAALVASKGADAAAAVRLAAFAQSTRKDNVRQQFDQQLFDAMRDELRRRLEAATYDRAWNEGAALTLDEATRLALAVA